MKRTYTLIALLCLIAGALVTGCNKEEANAPAPGATNAPAAPAMPGTNK